MFQLFQLLRRFGNDDRGNVFVLFGATAIPLMLILGGALDFARYTRYRTDLANAVDAAALALARQHPDYSAANAKTFITNYVNAIVIGDDKFSVQSYDVQKLDKGFQVTATGSVQTIFLPLGKFTRNGSGIDSMAVNVTNQVVNSSGRLELALVMDNTGSMNCGATLSMTCVNNWSSPASDSRIVAAKAAAKSLVDIVMPDNLTDNDQVKIAVVPFEGQVNVASAISDVTSPPSWIDWNDDGRATWNGANFDKRDTGTGATCTTGTNCKPVGHAWLFKQLTLRDSAVKWAGCVEMRAGSYELSDAAPSTSTPDSLFVPYFSPDEPDSPTTAGSSGATRNDYDSNGGSYGGTQYTYSNDYLNDKTAALPPTVQKDHGKYKKTTTYPIFWTGRKDTEGLTTPYEYGPNRGCPRPIYPLANASNKTAIKTQIDNMIGYYSSGTFLPAGLVWGWHVLSPGIPYTEGVAPGNQYYSRTIKAIVFFTDGENEVVDQSTPNVSNYNGYSYVGSVQPGTSTHRLSTTASGAITALDTKTATLCTNVKTNGTASDTSDDIRLYVVTFGSIDSATTTLMTNCASLDSDGTRLYYHAPTTSDLQDIFRAIGEDLSDIHLSM